MAKLPVSFTPVVAGVHGSTDVGLTVRAWATDAARREGIPWNVPPTDGPAGPWRGSIVSVALQDF